MFACITTAKCLCGSRKTVILYYKHVIVEVLTAAMQTNGNHNCYKLCDFAPNRIFHIVFHGIYM